MKKIIFFVFIIFMVLLVGVFSLQLNKKNISQTNVKFTQLISPTPTLVQSTEEIINQSKITNGMKQFKSDKYKFSISYPYDWQLLDEPNVNGIEIQKINSQGMGISISLRVNENPQKLSLQDYAKSQTLNPQDIPQKITVGNVQGYKLQYLPEGLLTTIYLPYGENNKVLYFFAGGAFDKSSQTFNVYNQIVNNVLNSLKLY